MCLFFMKKIIQFFSVSCEKIFKEQLDIEKSYDGILKKTMYLVVDCIEVKSSLQLNNKRVLQYGTRMRYIFHILNFL